MLMVDLALRNLPVTAKLVALKPLGNPCLGPGKNELALTDLMHEGG
jgi:hypothetical protein